MGFGRFPYPIRTPRVLRPGFIGQYPSGLRICGAWRVDTSGLCGSGRVFVVVLTNLPLKVSGPAQNLANQVMV